MQVCVHRPSVCRGAHVCAGVFGGVGAGVGMCTQGQVCAGVRAGAGRMPEHSWFHCQLIHSSCARLLPGMSGECIAIQLRGPSEEPVPAYGEEGRQKGTGKEGSRERASSYTFNPPPRAPTWYTSSLALAGADGGFPSLLPAFLLGLFPHPSQMSLPRRSPGTPRQEGATSPQEKGADRRGQASP